MIDLAKITLKAGDGGNGCISFRREKYIPRGGPDGGDGGSGGDIYFVAKNRKSTLLDFKYQTIFKSGRGYHGSGAKKAGISGEDLVVEIPVGTIVREYTDNDDKKLRDLNHETLNLFPIIYDFDRNELKHKIAQGGQGGRGNWHFRSSIDKAPKIAEAGVKGEEKQVILELKLIADVGLIGLPNAGKSTLISKLTLAKPKIAAYPFTTIEPNLGVCEYNKQDFVLADIPGLIEGASHGKGLGFEFLRHIERTKILVHVLGLDDEKLKPDDYWNSYCEINNELINYGHDLDKKPQITVMNKMDLPYVKEIYKDVRSIFKRHGVNILEISSFTGKGLEFLKKEIAFNLSIFKTNTDIYLNEEKKLHVFSLGDVRTVKKVDKNLIRR